MSCAAARVSAREHCANGTDRGTYDNFQTKVDIFFFFIYSVQPRHSCNIQSKLSRPRVCPCQHRTVVLPSVILNRRRPERIFSNDTMSGHLIVTHYCRIVNSHSKRVFNGHFFFFNLRPTK